MTPNPLSDALHFLVKPAWPTAIYWPLLIGSIAIALYAWRNIPSQRSWRNVGDWLCRFFIGTMWWQQTLWKIPPLYTDNPSDPLNSGLHYWMTREGQSAAFPLLGDFVNHIVLPNFYFFAPIVYALEVLTAVSLILGIFARLHRYGRSLGVDAIILERAANGRVGRAAAGLPDRWVNVLT